MLVGCGVDDVRINEPAPTPPPVQSPPFEPSLPRLAAGPHFGMITGFDPLDEARKRIATDHYAEARAAGMSIGRVQVDWAELEPAPGVYDGDAFDEAFADPNLAGLNLAVLVSTLDSDGLTVPAYLVRDGVLRDGLTLASPEVTDAFSDFLDWIAPRLLERNVWLLSIANEPLGPIEDAMVSESEAVQFYSAAMDRWNENVPQIGITATFTSEAPNGIPDLFAAVRARADIVAFNYYCLLPDITVSSQQQWESDVAGMKADAGSREIFLQELGCPVGYGPRGQPSAIGGSVANQAAFFEYFGNQFAQDPQLRAATAFQLYDWSPELAASFAKPIDAAGMPVLAGRLEEWLATVGLLRWSDASERPAWETWLVQNRRLKDQRGE